MQSVPYDSQPSIFLFVYLHGKYVVCWTVW